MGGKFDQLAASASELSAADRRHESWPYAKCALLCYLGGALAILGTLESSAIAKDVDRRLIGEWRIVESEQNRVRKTSKRDEPDTWRFGRDSIDMKYESIPIAKHYGRDKTRWSYQVSGGRDPRGIEAKFERDGEKLVMRGIYRIVDDKLEICACTDTDSIDVFVGAPIEFQSDKGDGRVLLLVFERVRPGDRVRENENSR